MGSILKFLFARRTPISAGLSSFGVEMPKSAVLIGAKDCLDTSCTSTYVSYSLILEGSSRKSVTLFGFSYCYYYSS